MSDKEPMEVLHQKRLTVSLALEAILKVVGERKTTDKRSEVIDLNAFRRDRDTEALLSKRAKSHSPKGNLH